jgi:hypothetical protein
MYGSETATSPVKPCVDKWLNEAFAGHGLSGATVLLIRFIQIEIIC